MARNAVFTKATAPKLDRVQIKISLILHFWQVKVYGIIDDIFCALDFSHWLTWTSWLARVTDEKLAITHGLVNGGVMSRCSLCGHRFFSLILCDTPPLSSLDKFTAQGAGRAACLRELGIGDVESSYLLLVVDLLSFE